MATCLRVDKVGQIAFLRKQSRAICSCRLPSIVSRSHAVAVSAVARPQAKLQRTLATVRSVPLSNTEEVAGDSAEPWYLPMAKFAAVCFIGFALAFGAPSAAEAARSGGRAGGGAFRMAAARSSSSSLRGGGGYGSSLRAPSVGVGIGLPSVFVPMGGYGYGYGGVGYYSFSNTLFTVLTLCFMAYVAVNVFGSFMSSDDDGETASVAKLQVGLLASAKELKRDLDGIAMRADTDTPEGLHFLLQEAVLALMRNPQYCVYGAVESEMTNMDKAEKRFSAISLEERSKFAQETLVNVGGYQKSSGYKPSASSASGVNELIVVTLMVAVDGRLDLPKINSLQDLRSALAKLGGVGSNQVLGVELLWTPQAEGDFYTRDEIIADYPKLVSL